MRSWYGDECVADGEAAGEAAGPAHTLLIEVSSWCSIISRLTSAMRTRKPWS